MPHPLATQAGEGTSARLGQRRLGVPSPALSSSWDRPVEGHCRPEMRKPPMAFKSDGERPFSPRELKGLPILPGGGFCPAKL